MFSPSGRGRASGDGAVVKKAPRPRGFVPRRLQAGQIG